MSLSNSSATPDQQTVYEIEPACAFFGSSTPEFRKFVLLSAVNAEIRARRVQRGPFVRPNQNQLSATVSRFQQ